MVRTGKRRIKEFKDALDGITLARLAVEMRPIASLKPYARNPRTHSDKQIRQIAESIRVFGFNNPVLIDRNDEIIAGHGRVDAAKLLGLESVPTPFGWSTSAKTRSGPTSSPTINSPRSRAGIAKSSPSSCRT